MNIISCLIWLMVVVILASRGHTHIYTQIAMALTRAKCRPAQHETKLTSWTDNNNMTNAYGVPFVLAILFIH